ncbi:MAG: nuclear transport factor 2 family protein [Pseudomonadota bacterium]
MVERHNSTQRPGGSLQNPHYKEVLSIMNKEDIEDATRAFLAKRLENNPGTTLEFFSENAVVHFPGSEDASAIASTVRTRAALEALIEHLFSTWRWDAVHIESLFLGKNSSVVRYRLEATHLPSGQALSTESMDEFHFDETGQISTLIEFVDTAKAAELEALAQ